MEDDENQTVSLQMQVDLRTNTVIGALLNKKEVLSPEQLDIASGIVNRMKNLFNSDGSDWINDYLDHIEKQRFMEAYDLLINKYTFLKRPISSSVFDNLLKLDYRKLPKEKQYNYFIHIIALGYRGNFYKQIEEILSLVENEFHEFIDKETLYRIHLTKSDIFIKTKNHLSANMLLNIIISEPECPDVIKAYAYRQLSWLSPLEKDRLIYFERAYDLFLISGHRSESIEELINSYNILLSKSPSEALNKIDLAIKLLETESYIDKNISAWLCKKKAHVLFIQKRYDKCFIEIQKAIDFQKDLIGIESEKYTTYKFAEELMRIIGNKKKQTEFSLITSSLKKKLPSNDYLDIQFSMEEAFLSKQAISDELKRKIFEKGTSEQKFGYFLISALSENVKFEEKLHLLDMALQIQESYTAEIADVSLLYNTIAEVYKEYGDITKAVEWFEKTFSISPFNMVALQNYLHLLWENKFWDRLEDVCKRYIDIIGYSPNLYYIYGKSLLSQSKYGEALVVFGKCKKDIKFPIDKEIIKCSEHITNSDLIVKSLLSEKKMISINEFINAAKEVTDSISQRSRMYLWKYDKKHKTYKWKSKPEEEVKNLFIQGIVQKFNPYDFDIIEEVKTGAGRIDLYVTVGSDLKIIIELKMCGHGYSFNYASSGEFQLVNYLESKKLHLGILIVFDGRTRDFSKGFSEIVLKNNKLINTIIVDMRPEIKREHKQ